ncbi:NYN domain-containing protein [Calothrix sp. UHCC 0171]|uniref:LabA-like NYN domain-containing protein n=1 Tax=Calothrix sp. UHCC 0171 TaxID=3110245 RepID=UPI002B1F88CD|nr:NYN domain-containing protein [Calothrix sp. UHCC 0171]MEA5570092.1 NYN domain-containing protein [Calothrix sp. UHCC 0171]
MQLFPRPQMNNQLRLQLESETEVEPPSLQLSDEPEVSRSRRRKPQNRSDRDRVAIFIDGANLFYAAMQLNLEIDYAKLLRCLTKERQLIRAYFYTACDSSNDKQQGFLLWMSRNGYRVISKELIQFPDGSKKANLDVEIAVDMLVLSKSCDTIVLLSGDGDLAYAVNSIAYQGVQVEVVSLGSMTSDSLINVADAYTDLEEMKGKIQRKKG